MLLAGAGTVVGTASPSILADAIGRLGHPAQIRSDGSLHTDLSPTVVGEMALSLGLALTELRAADGSGLEEIFLDLTHDTQREGALA